MSIDIETRYREFFRVAAQITPPVYLAKDPEMSSGQPSPRSPSIDSLKAFQHLVSSHNATIMTVGAGVSAFVLRAIYPNVITVDFDETWLRTVEAICVRAGVAGWNGSFSPNFDGKAADFVLVEGTNPAYLHAALRSARYGALVPGGGHHERRALRASAIAIAEGLSLPFQAAVDDVYVRGPGASRGQPRPVDQIEKLNSPASEIVERVQAQAQTQPRTRPRPVPLKK